jgi:hypothetical protein
MSVKAKDTPAGAVAPKGAAAEPAKPFLSEGVRVDLEQHGKATDPATGGVFEMDDSGAVTFTDRAGKVTEL